MRNCCCSAIGDCMLWRCWQSQRPDHTINGEATTGETGSKLDSYITAHSHDILFPWQKNVKLWPFAHDHIGPKLLWECWSNWERLLWYWVGILAFGLHFLKTNFAPFVPFHSSMKTDKWKFHLLQGLSSSSAGMKYHPHVLTAKRCGLPALRQWARWALRWALQRDNGAL